MLRTLVLLLAVAAALAPRAAAQDGTAQVQELPQFSTVQACVPFNILISPSGADGQPSYGLQVDAEPAVAQAIQWTVNNGTLALETGGFVATQPIKVVVYLPPDAFSALDHLGQLSTVYIGNGFTPDSFTLRQGAGGGGVYIFGMTANSLTISALGSMGDVVAMGTFGTVQVSTQGISNVYIAGVTQSVSLQLAGISTIFLQPQSPDVTITGSADGISNVYYSQGQCQVQSAFLLSSPCQQSMDISAARAVPTPSWTQGLQAVGAFSCAVGESFLTPQLQLPTMQPFPFPQPLPTPIPAPTPPPAPVPSPPAPTPPPTTTPPPVAAPVAQPPSAAPGQGPYAFTVPGPTGTQSQAGMVAPGSRQAQASATGQRQASSQAVAGPGGVQTGTSSDGQGFVAGALAPPFLVPQPTPQPTAPAPAPAPAATAPAPAPVPEAEGPYAFTVPGATGTQSQAGSVTPAGSKAQSAATGQRQASAVSVAGPGGVRTGTSSDGQGFTAGTRG